MLALVLVERLLRVHPGLLLPCTLRPVLLVSFVLSLKIKCDEALDSARKAILRAGLVHVDGSRLWQLEAAYLEAVAWDVSSCWTSNAAAIARVLSCNLRGWLADRRATAEPIPHVAVCLAASSLCVHRLAPAYATGQGGGGGVPSVHV